MLHQYNPDRNLPYWNILKSSGALLWTKRNAILKAIWPALIFLILLDFATDQMAELSRGIFRYGVLVLQMMMGALLAVNCHRLAILGESSCKMTWGKRETIFTFCEIALGALVALGLVLGSLMMLYIPVLQDAGMNWFIMVPPALGIAYLFARCLFVLPAIAVDEPSDIVTAWQRSRKNGWRLFLVVILLPWLALLGIAWLPSNGASMWIGVVYSALGYLSWIFGILTLSLSFNFLARGKNSA